MQHVFTRPELYDLAWSEPISKLAPRYGISGVAFAKMCRRHMIPLPPRGYWAKLTAGKKVSMVPLPPRSFGMPAVISRGRDWHYVNTHDLINEKIPEPPEFSESVWELTERARKLVGQVKIMRGFARAHTLIRKLLEADEGRRKKQAESQFPYWDKPRFDSVAERRRLRLANAIFQATQCCGMKPRLSCNDTLEFGIRVGEQSVSFSITLQKRRLGRESKKRQREQLRLEISPVWVTEDVPLVWEDKGEEKIEKQVQDMVVSLIVTGEIQYRQGELWRHDRLRELKEEAEREETKRRKEEVRLERERRVLAEKERADRLLSEASAYRQARQIREYVSGVRKDNSRCKEPVARAEIDAWAAWALRQADSLDPVITKRYLRDISFDDQQAVDV